MIDDRQHKMIRRLASEGLKTLEFFRSLPPAGWQIAVYSAGAGWTARDVLSHLLNAEQGFHHLLCDIKLGGSGAPEELPLDTFNEQQAAGSAVISVEQLLEDFAAARLTTIEIVRDMTGHDLDRTGRHPFLGVTTVDRMIELIYRHTMIHQRDIRRALEKGGPVDTA